MKINTIAVILMTAIFASCASNQKKTDNQTVETPPTSTEVVTAHPQNEHVEILYFHGKKRCATCIAIETLTKEVLQESFATEMNEGKVAFRDIDISKKKNESITDKYEVSWSSLFVNKWNGSNEERNNMTEFGFSYAKNDPASFKDSLKTTIYEMLNKPL